MWVKRNANKPAGAGLFDEQHFRDSGVRYRLQGEGKSIDVGGVPREQKMLKGHVPRVIYHHVY